MRRLLTTLAFLAACSTVVLVESAHADSTPVGPLPAGPVQTITVKKGQLVALALPRPSRSSGLVWRVARAYDAEVVEQTEEADVGRLLDRRRVQGDGDGTHDGVLRPDPR